MCRSTCTRPRRPPPVQEAYFGGLPEPFGQMLSTAAWGWHAETGLHALRLMAAGVFDRFPDVQIILGHMGEDLPFSVARADYLFERAPHPLSRKPSEILASNFHLTVSGYFTLPPLRCALEMVGADRVLFAVDFPYSKNSEGRAFLDSLTLSAEGQGEDHPWERRVAAAPLMKAAGPSHTASGSHSGSVAKRI